EHSLEDDSPARRLQTKVFEPTTTVDFGIFLDVRTTRPPLRGSNPELLELEIVAAASIASFALGHGYRAGLYVNQNQRLSNEPIRIPPSQHTDQLMHILEALAQLHPSETTPIDRLVLYEGRNLHWGSTLVVISAAPTDTLTSTLLKMKRVGRRVSLILVGGKEPAAGNNGLNVYHVPDDVRWRDLEELPLRGNNHQ
ncbi:MAG: hypothetical protein U1B77_03395, partial [Dehalococcoidales bacterium]|nr:hypothetical protein [Dehalococcoidales bacterium]